jgi:hypothetical protein
MNYIGLMVTSQSPEILRRSDNVVSAMGQAVGDSLMCSRQFIRESLAESFEDDTTGIGRDARKLATRRHPMLSWRMK